MARAAAILARGGNAQRAAGDRLDRPLLWTRGDRGGGAAARAGRASCRQRELPAQVVVRDELNRLVRLRGAPRSVRVDIGPDFAGRMLDQWAYLNKVEIDFSRPAGPAATRWSRPSIADCDKNAFCSRDLGVKHVL